MPAEGRSAILEFTFPLRTQHGRQCPLADRAWSDFCVHSVSALRCLDFWVTVIVLCLEILEPSNRASLECFRRNCLLFCHYVPES